MHQDDIRGCVSGVVGIEVHYGGRDTEEGSVTMSAEVKPKKLDWNIDQSNT